MYSQQDHYMASLYKYDEGLVKAVESNYREKDWAYNSAQKEWSNEKLNVNFRGAKAVAPGAQGGAVPL